MKSVVSIIGMLFLFGQPSMADDTTADDQCLDKEKVDLIRDVLSLPEEAEEEFDLCDPKLPAYQLMESLVEIYTIRFKEADLGTPYNQGILSTDFWEYFSERVDTIVNESECDRAVAYVYPFDPGVVHICPPFYQNMLAQERAEVMLHEARHFDGYRHVTCTRGPRKGIAGACDKAIDQKGSYAVTVESLAKMAMLGEGLTAAERSLTKITALGLANETFNVPVVPHDLGALYLTNGKGESFFYHQESKELKPAPTVDTGAMRVVSRNVALALFPNDRSDAATLDVFSNKLNLLPGMGSFSLKYNETEQDKRPEVVDIVNAPYATASVTREHIQARLAGTTDPTEIDTPWSIRAIYTSTELGENNTDSFYALSDEGKIYRVKLLRGQKYEITETALSTEGFRSLVVFDEQRVGLNDAGQLLVSKEGTWIPYPGLEDKEFQSVTRPFYWTEYFVDTE